MFLGKVIGRVVPAVIHESMVGIPLLWVQPLDKNSQPEGNPFVCADGTRMAGPDEIVYWEASREAARILRGGLKELLAAAGHRGPRIPQQDQPTEQRPEEQPGLADDGPR